MQSLFFLVFSAFIILFSWLNVSALKPSLATQSYVETLGEIMNISRVDDPKKVKCDVQYRYQVGGVSYTGTVVGADLKGWYVNGREPLCDLVSEFAVGERVVVAYDPTAPEHAVAFNRFPTYRAFWQAVLVLMWGVALYRTFFISTSSRPPLQVNRWRNRTG